MLRKIVKPKKNNNQSILKMANERYEEAGTPQLEKYIKEIEESAIRGGESCYLLTDSEYPMRKEHIELLLSKGYDLNLSKRRHMIHDNRSSYWATCYWTKDSSGKVESDYDWENE